MAPLELTEQAVKIIERVKKLLALAADERGNEHQASAAAAKAQELLQAYNLDMAMVGTGTASARSKTNLKGGLYRWQRDLWRAVSDLNFCMYWSIKGLTKGSAYQHRILGRQENVIGSQVMAEYLQQAVDRLAQNKAKTTCKHCGESREYCNERYHEFTPVNVFAREMIAFREGMSRRLVERLNRVRREKLEEERRQERERAAAQQTHGSTENAIVLSSVIQTEADLNEDFNRGLEPGTTARRRAEAEANWKAYMQEVEQWLRDNPEEAARLKAQQEREEEKARKREARNKSRRKGDGYSYRKTTAEELRSELPEFREGYRKADDISLNQQVKDADEKRRLE